MQDISWRSSIFLSTLVFETEFKQKCLWDSPPILFNPIIQRKFPACMSHSFSLLLLILPCNLKDSVLLSTNCKHWTHRILQWLYCLHLVFILLYVLCPTIWKKIKRDQIDISSNLSLIPEALEELLDCVEHDYQPLYHLLTIYWERKTFSSFVCGPEKALHALSLKVFENPHTTFSLCFLSCIIWATKWLS